MSNEEMKTVLIVYGEEIKKLQPVLDKIKDSGKRGNGFFSFNSTLRIKPLEDEYKDLAEKFNSIQNSLYLQGVKRIVYSLIM